MALKILALVIVVIVILFLISGMVKKCQNRVIDAVMRYAPDAQTILDLGCGRCCSGVELESKGKTVVSLDVVDLGVCKTPILFNGSDIPYPDKSFDLGICSFVLHHTATQIRLLQELKRTCKTIIIIENTPESLYEISYTQIHSKSNWGSCSKCFKSIPEWIEVFNDNCFSIKAVERLNKYDCPFSDYPWWYPVTCAVFVLSAD